MRTNYFNFGVCALGACVLSFWLGHWNGTRLIRSERKGDIVFANEMYKAATATNLTRLHSFLDIKLLALIREYERRWGTPPVTDSFGRAFAEGKLAADRIQTNLVPVIPAITNAFPDLKVEGRR